MFEDVLDAMSACRSILAGIVVATSARGSECSAVRW